MTETLVQQTIDVGAIAEKVNRQEAVASSGLLGRARAALTAQNAWELEREASRFQDETSVLLKCAGSVLDQSLTPSLDSSAITVDDDGRPVLNVDGFQFRLDRWWEEGNPSLLLVRECTRCGGDTSARLHHLARLAELVAESADHATCPTPPDPRTPEHRAEAAVAEVERAAKELGAARAHEQTLEDRRPMMKSAAIRRLMGTENPETSKPHSASSAEKIVESDAEYFAFRQQQASAVVATEEARGKFAAAKLRAELAIATLNEVR